MKAKLLLSVILLCTVSISYGQWTQTVLSESKIRMGGATLGTKAYFAGGQFWFGSDWYESDKVEIYDFATDTWQMAYLSQARVHPTGVTCGDWVFFAGGVYNFPENATSRVDIFNSQGIWDIAELSVPRFAMSAVSNDSLVLFAGGATIMTNEFYDVVDIYNIYTNQWSVDHLSAHRAAMGSAVAGDIAFFAGGDSSGTYFNRVDIYHFSTGTWTIDSLSMARTWIGATVAGNKVIFAGGGAEGGFVTDVVDIYDIETGTWDEPAQLSIARGFFTQQAATVCGKAYFAGGTSFETDYDTIDVYDPVSNEWSVMTMPNRLTWHTVVAIENSMLVAGGFTYTTYPYGNAQNNVEIYTDPTVGILSQHIEDRQSGVSGWPNPFWENTTLEYELDNDGVVNLTVYNQIGQQVAILVNEYKSAGRQQLTWDAEGLPNGVYYCRLQAGDKVGTGKLILIK